MLKVSFRADASNTIGSGHVIEIISLIRALRERIEFEPVFVTVDNAFTIEKLRESGMSPIICLPGGLPEEEEAERVVRGLEDLGCEHLVVDLLHRSNDFYGYLHSNLKSTCVILDNNEHKEIPASLVVNFSITQDPDFYQNADQHKTKYLIGPGYFWFDEVVKKIKPVNVVGPKVERVFVNQGGSDPYGLTVKIIRALELGNFEQEFHVVLGGLLQDEHKVGVEYLRNSIKGNYKFYADLPKIDLYHLMGKSDVAISAAGNTLYELAFLGVPTLVISHDQLHDRVASAFAQKKAAINVGIGTDLAESQIASALGHLVNDAHARLTLSKNARNLFNSGSGTALIEELVTLYSR